MNFRKQYIQFLKESVLNTLVETASTKAPQYKINTPEEFNMLVSLDPTYNSSKDDGSFINWIFGLYRQFKTDDQNEKKYQKAVEYQKEHPGAALPSKPQPLSQDKIEDFEKIKDLLDILKDRVNLKTFDMNQFKSVADLATYVRNIKNKDIPVDKKAEESYKVFRAAIDDGLEVVYDGPNFVIGVPTTYEASSHFKKPVTDWCTAYPEMYDRYLKEYGGKYYIHLNKHTGDLYQAHYESDQFKDASDNEIDKREFIEKYPELKNFYDKIWNMNRANWWVLHNRKPTEKVQLAAVKRNGYAIEYIQNPSEAVQFEAVNNTINALQYIKNPSEKVQLAAVKHYGRAIELIENPSETVQLATVRNWRGAICYIQNPTEKVKIAAVKSDVEAIRFIQNPSEAIQLAAVTENGEAIKYIENPSEKVQLAAVKSNGNAIQYIQNPTEEMKLAAVGNWGEAIQYIKNPSEAIQLAAVKRDGYAIRYIKNPSEAVRLAADQQKAYSQQFEIRESISICY